MPEPTATSTPDPTATSTSTPTATSTPDPLEQPSADPYTIYLPLLLRSGTSAQPAEGAADVVGTITLSPDRPGFAAGEPVSITVAVPNQGDAATADGVQGERYLNPATEPVVISHGMICAGCDPATQ
jgi:hypothetical protein